MAVDIELLKQLREETGAGIADCRSALVEAKGNASASSAQVMDKAKEILKQKGLDKAGSKSDREAGEGIVEAYSHNGKIGVLVELRCETDFVAKTEDFKTLAHEIALQIASMDPEDPESLLKQEYIRDPGMKIEDLIKLSIAKLGENIKIGRFARISLGK